MCGDTCAGSGTRADPAVHQRWQIQRVAELVQPGLLDSADERVLGCLDQTDFNNTLERLANVGFIREGTGADILRPEILTEAGVTCP